MADIPRFTGKRSGQSAIIPPMETGADQTWSTLAKISADFTKDVSDLADLAREQEATIEGQELGMQADAGDVNLPPPDQGMPVPGSITEIPGGESTATAAAKRGVAAGVRGLSGQQAMRFYQSKGLSKIAAAAMVGNLAAESGGFSPDVISGARRGDQGTAAYVQQLRLDRRSNYEAWAANRPGGVGSLDNQLEWSWQELTTSHAGVLARLKSASSLDEAMDAAIGYEAPQGYSLANPRGGHNYIGRLNHARDAMILSEGGVAPTGGPTSVVTATLEPRPTGPIVVPAGEEGREPQGITLTPGIGITSRAIYRAASKTAEAKLTAQVGSALDQIIIRYENEPGKIGPAVDEYMRQRRGLVVGAPEIGIRMDALADQARNHGRLLVGRKAEKDFEEAKQDGYNRTLMNAGIAVSDIAIRHADNPDKVASVVDAYAKSHRALVADDPDALLKFDALIAEAKLGGVKMATEKAAAAQKETLEAAHDRLLFETSKEINAITLKYADQPEKIAPEIRDYAETRRPQVGDDPKKLLEFDKLIEAKSFEALSATSRAEMDRQKEERVAAKAEQYTHQLSEIGRAARMVGTGPGSQGALAFHLDRFNKLLAGDKDISAPKKQELRNALAQEVGTAQVLSAFDRSASPSARKRFLDSFRQSWLTGDSKLGLNAESYDKITADMERRIIQDEQAANTRSRLLNEQLNTLTTVLTKGGDYPPEELTKLKGQITLSGDPALQRRLQFTQQFSNWAKRAMMVQPERAAADLALVQARIDSGSFTPEDLAWKEGMLDTLDRINKSMKDDPLGHAFRVGLVPVGAVPITAGEAALTVGLTQRKATAEAANAYWNKTAAFQKQATYFTKAETDLFAKELGKNPDLLLGFARSIDTVFGNSVAGQRALGELSKQAPELAQVTGIYTATKSDRLVREVSETMKRRVIEGYEPVKVPGGVKQQAIGDVMGVALHAIPDSEQSTIALADTLFEGRAAIEAIDLTTDAGKETARGIYAQALMDANGFEAETGGFGVVNGLQTSLPAGVTDDQFQDAVRLLNNDDVAKMEPMYSANGVPIRAHDLRRAKFVFVGGGRYRIALGDPRVTGAQDFVKREANPNEFYTVTAQQILDLTAGRTEEILRRASQGPDTDLPTFGLGIETNPDLE